MRDRARELTQHAAWLHRLALSLVGDVAAAEDLTQDTWVAALSTELDQDRPLRPWLRRVATNFARRSFRRREKPGESPDQKRAPDKLGPVEVTERLETERLLTDALTALEEPLRTTLYLRFYEGLQPKEIAERLETPGGTVRWRLKRGLELLRERLDSKVDGGREAWCALLMPLAEIALRDSAAAAALGTSTATLSTGSVGLTGVIAMNTLLKIIIVLTAGIALYVGLDATGNMPSSLSLARDGGTPVDVAFRPIDTEPGPVSDSSLNEAPAANIRVAETPVPEPKRIEKHATENLETAVVALIHDEFGRPVANAVVSRTGREEAQSDTEGRVRLVVDIGSDETLRAPLRISKPGRITRGEIATLELGEEFDLGTVVLGPGGSIRGRVTSATGHPIAEADITWAEGAEVPRHLEAVRYQSPIASVPSTVTRNDGRFVLEGLPPGHVRLWARAEGFTPQYTDPIEVRAGQETYGVEIPMTDLSPEHHFVLQVLDPSGNPVPSAELDYRHQSREAGFSISGSAEADLEGRHEFLVDKDARLWITASDPEGRFGSASAAEVSTGDELIVLQLPEVEHATVSVRNPDNSPAEEFRLQVRSADGEFTYQTLDDEPRVDGNATFRVPDRPFLLRIVAPLAEIETFGPVDPKAVGEPLVRLKALPGLHGRILHEGIAVAGAELTLHKVANPGGEYLVNGFRCAYQHSVEDRATADEEGRFILTLRESGDYVVRAEAADFAAADTLPFTVTSDLRGPEVELELVRGGAIEGRVITPEGENPVGTVVGISRGDTAGRTLRVKADGEYRFEGLTPGPWRVVIRDDEIRSGSTTTTHRDNGRTVPYESLDWDCQVLDGETTFHDVRQKGAAEWTFEGTLTTSDTNSVPWGAKLIPPQAFFADNGFDEVILDEDGNFSIPVEKPGEAQLVLHGAWAGVTEYYIVKPVHSGTDSPYTLDLSTATLVLEGVDAWDGQDMPKLAFVHEGASDMMVLIAVGGDEEGVCRMERVPTGKSRIVRPSKDNMDPRAWETVREIEVSTVGETRVRL